MIQNPLRRRKDLHFQRSYPASLDAVWSAWTDADQLRQWWGPEKTTIDECEVDLRVGGRLRVVTVATEEMGKYAGTRWPMEGTFTHVEAPRHLAYDARSWTEGEEESATIHHTNDLTLTGDGTSTTVTLHVAITEIGPKAKMAAFGMKWGYKAQLDALEQLLGGA
ncbi:SRPBCC family protein [Actinomarinicola tropica]|uniref:SRPBCC family protein n=1 Tax=Actinomarinicola tropica TaxID=2789776 RepID=UPI00189A0854|nr:SRPBCC domain-containing protein [Actinomarinicola tropica]